MNLEVLFLGTGTSHGVPMIACDCSVCTSPDPRDKRNRPSILISANGSHLLVDTPPELRLSCINYGVKRVDAILFTHHHADHILGLDDVRRFNHVNDSAISCYGTRDTLNEVRQTFRYAFGTQHFGGGLPVIMLQEITGSFQVNGVTIQPLPVWHGPTPVVGFRIGAFAYLTDVKTIPDETMDLLGGLDVLVLGVLRHRPHPTHLSVQEALELLDKIQPKKVFFTHIAHDLGHEKTEAGLPDNIRLAFDGMALTLDA